MAHLPSPLLTTARLIAGGPLNAASSRSGQTPWACWLLTRRKRPQLRTATTARGLWEGPRERSTTGKRRSPVRALSKAWRSAARPEERGRPLRRLPRRAVESSAAPTTARLSRWRPLPRRRCSRPWMLHQAEKKLCHSKMEAQAEAAIAVGHYLSSRASASASGRQGHERRGASSLRPDAKHTTTRSWRACSPPRASCVTWPTAVSRGTTEPAHLNAPASLRAGRLESWYLKYTRKWNYCWMHSR